MGTVYKVRHLISERLEAMKLVLPELTENPELADRFMREIKLQARLSHPNIASLHNALRIGNQLMMVMELIEGSSLHAVMRQGAMDPNTAIETTAQILLALEYAHAQGVIHRDIKPANIMLNSARQVKLMDFGIARSVLEENQLTRTGTAVGSVFYMSPEQVQGTAVDARADLYSVGVLLYEMVTGVRPIAGESSWAIMNAHIHTVPRTPSSVNPEVPEPLSLAIMKAVAKAPADRFQSARSFLDSLMEVRSRMTTAGQQPTSNSIPTEVVPPNWSTPHKSAPMYAPNANPQVATPPPVSSTPASGTPQSTAGRFETERLEKLTRELATFVGPMARVLVSRAAKKAQTWKQLYETLAAEVPEGTERRQFLAKRP